MSLDLLTAKTANASSAPAAGTKVAAVKSESGPEPASANNQAPQVPDMKEAVRAAARQIESYLRSVNRLLEFRVDAETGVTVVTVRETATGEVIRQIPGEEVLQLARHLKEGSGTLLSLVV